jgi:N-acetylglucosaminyl-diphospho-decaprenol L-rhamnosyltransferase
MILCLDIIIVNWNSGNDLRSCLLSIRKHGIDRIRQIIIIDNGSTDDSLLGIEEIRIPIKIVKNDSNRGFAAACNQGARMASGEYLLFLNPDTRLFHESLLLPLTFLEEPSNAEVGICGIQLVDEYGKIARTCARFPKPLQFIYQALGVDRIMASRGYFMWDWDHLTNKVIDHVIGAFFLVRREVFEQIRGFDERFYVYLEDLDFSLRARHSGWTSYYLADARAIHKGGGSSKQVKGTRLFYALRSRLLYSFKHFSRFSAWVICVTTILIEPFCRIAIALARGSWMDVRYTWDGYIMLIRSGYHR